MRQYPPYHYSIPRLLWLGSYLYDAEAAPVAEGLDFGEAFAGHRTQSKGIRLSTGHMLNNICVVRRYQFLLYRFRFKKCTSLHCDIP
jgi:hypothetical protein